MPLSIIILGLKLHCSATFRFSDPYYQRAQIACMTLGRRLLYVAPVKRGGALICVYLSVFSNFALYAISRRCSID